MTSFVGGRSRGLFYIIVATVVAGMSGYTIQLLAPALLTDYQQYLSFTVFWSTLFLFGGAIAGVQQEVTRAAHPALEPVRTDTLRDFTMVSIGVVALATVCVGATLAQTAFQADPFAMTVWFGLGLVGYLLVSVASGLFYGLSIWRAIAALTIVDACLRAMFVAVGFFANAPPSLLAGAVAAPFILAFGIVWLTVRRSVIGRFVLDVPVSRLSLNVLGTVLAAAATGIMVTGLPLLIRLLMPGEPAAVLATIIVVITVTRAPLIIPMMALQSFLITEFRGPGAPIWRRLSRYLIAILAVSVLAATAAYLWGSQVIAVISGDRYDVAPFFVACVVASAGMVAALFLTGAALLSMSRHAVYVAGWLTGAGLTVVLLLIPTVPETRVLTALIVAPLVGLVIHLVGVRPRAAFSGTPPSA